MTNDKYERKIVSEFLRRNNFDHYEKNMQVGRAFISPLWLKRLRESGQEEVAMKKIDLVVNASANEVWIYEAKQRMNMKSLGQLLTYKYMYVHETGVPAQNVKLGLLYTHADPMIFPVFDHYGIKTIKIIVGT